MHGPVSAECTSVIVVRVPRVHLCLFAQYGALLMVDLEEEYFPEEIAKLEADVAEG